LALVLALGIIQPSSAETAGQTSTRNIIIAATAVTLGIILYNNYVHKTRAYNTVVGYTRDGGTVYADGRIVYPDGTVVYTSNNGRTRCGYLGYGVPCNPGARGYAWRYENEREDERHGMGLRKGWYKHHHHHGENEDHGDHGDHG
jgi:hypothetical protein